ncbi:MAG: hypothetical protein D3X82_04820 [Candidatus Leucobacter sulfamidivorax]|nr:hypothetical protein [Candidatus Leucobacter sulfamidivorax]
MDNAIIERRPEDPHEHPHGVHEATRYDAGDGQGTVSGPPYGTATQDRPVLDGSTLSPEEERGVVNPWRGIYDPELRRHPAHEPHRDPQPEH